MSVQVFVTYEGGLRCVAEHEPSGRTLETDAPVDNGGRGSAFSPTDLVAAALGTCLLTIVGAAAERMGLDFVGTKLRVVKTMVRDPLRRIGRLDVTLELPDGLNLTPDQRTKLEHAAHTCPVKQSLSEKTEVSIAFRP